MLSQDKKEKERSDAKNAVEEYVYDMRGKIDGGAYEKFSDDKIRQKLLNDLQSTEDWLYDDGMDQEKNVYVDRLKNLKVSHCGDGTDPHPHHLFQALGDPIRARYTEAENRQHHMQDMMKSIQRIDEAIQIYYTKSSDKYSHIDANDIEKANKILSEKQTWYDQTANRFGSLRAHDDATILCSHIKQERDVSDLAFASLGVRSALSRFQALEKECWAILNKAKPKVEPPKDTEPPKQQSPQANNQQQAPSGTAPPPTAEPSMEVD